MSYKQTLLKETKNCINKLNNEIKELIKTNKLILNFENPNKFDLEKVEKNFRTIKEKEEQIQIFTANLKEILKMDNAA